MNDSRLITRFVLRNYKSIAGCDVALGNLTFLVGPNGAGKSNILDALRFVSDSLNASLDHSLRERGGITEVRRRSSGHPTHFGIRLDFRLQGEATGTYAFSIASAPQGAYSVQREECHVSFPPYNPTNQFSYRVENGSVVRASFEPHPPASQDRLYLINAAGFSEFRLVYDALSQMGFYSLNPEEIRDLQSPDPGFLLRRDGSNLASVLSRLQASAPSVKRRIQEYLAKVVPGVESVDSRPIGPKETIEFRQLVRGATHPWRFLAANMSDGTLRTLGVLVALFQRPPSPHSNYRLVGIEEPEIALHPAAAGVLTSSLADASERTQVVVTSHSPDLLDNDLIPAESILAVIAEHGDTRVGRLDEAGRSVLRDHLYTAGELLRMDQLRPDPTSTTADPNRLSLFD
jgi:predicted ATPase